MEHDNPAVRTNALICLIHQANYLLDQQIAALDEQFVSEGGKPMVLRTAKTGKNAGHPFWGCSAYPDCKGVTAV